MAWIHGLRARLRGILRGRAADRELEEEFRFHVEMETERLVGEGLSGAEARRQALLAFGGLAQHKETMRMGRGVLWLENVLRDVRLASRGLRRSGSLVVGALLSLGLAMGLNTSVFSFLNATLYRPLNVPSGDRLVLPVIEKQGMPLNVRYARYREYQERVKLLDGLAMHASSFATVRAPGGVPVQRSLAVVSGNYFQVLGMRPQLGRFFLPDEDRTPGTHPVVVVSDYFWRREMRGDRQAIGRTLLLNRRPFLIVGVAPPGFSGSVPPEAFDIFVPAMMAGSLSLEPGPAGAAGNPRGELIGRLRPGASVAQVRAEFAAVTATLDRMDPAHAAGGVDVAPLRGVFLGFQKGARPFLFMLMGLVATTLLAAAANVAGLLLARAEARTRELAIQSSLGAGRSALVRVLLVESVLLVVPGAVLGLLLAPLGARGLLTFLSGPTFMRVALDLSPDRRVFAFGLAIAVLMALTVGAISAFRATRRDLMNSLRGEAPSARRHGRLAATVVVAQVALAVPLLFFAGMSLRVTSRILPREPGVRLDAVEAGALLDGNRYETPAARAAFFDRLRDGLLARPEIASVGLMSSGVLGLGGVVRLPGEPAPKPGFERRVPVNAVTPEVRTVLGLHLLRGRFLESGDVDGTPLVAVATAALCERLWPGRDPIGARLVVDERTYEIVGVVRDAQLTGSDSRYLFLSYRQNPNMAFGPSILALARARDPRTILPVIRRAAAAIDPEVPTRIATIGDRRRDAFRSVGAIGNLISGCALLTLILAAVGTYALLSFRVVRRNREIGVRMALGARSRDVQLLVVRQGMGLVVPGLVLGLPAGVFGLRLVGIGQQQPGDALIVAVAVVAMVAVISAIASWLPARRASHVEPATVLRLE